MIETETRSDPPDNPTLRIVNGIEWFIDWIGRGTAWICLAIVLVVANNVILRYLFKLGPVSLQELEWHLMSPIALIGMSYAMRHDDHVRVDIFFDRLSARGQAAVELASALAALIISVVIITLSFNFVYQAYSIGEGSPDPGGLPYRFLLRSFIPLGFALLALQAVAKILRTLVLLARRA
ncbi:MAG: TRAP transporter small permease subunit [Methyloligellaceae bacterium]